MSVLAIGVQVFSYATVGPIIPASFFTPVPKVNSQVLVLKPRSKPLIEEEYLDNFFRIVKAGFSEKRKKIKTSLSHSLSMSRDNVESILSNIDIDSNARAETLSIQDWKKIELSIFYHDSKRSTEDISK
jgi:16S rRNA (adenine1518-N6/adenine1519-N6)-dimethyltransferase